MRARPRIAALVLLCSPLIAAAQGAQLKLPAFDHLQEHALKAVDVTIGTWPLQLASRLVDEDDPQAAELKELLQGLKAVYVRSYEFDADFAYSKSDIEAVRRQLTAPGWTSLMQVRSAKDQSSVDVCLKLENGKINGLAIVAAEPRQFTILNVVGSIDPARLGQLEAQLGLPELAGKLR